MVSFVASRPFNSVCLFWNKDDVSAKSDFSGSAFGSEMLTA